MPRTKFMIEVELKDGDSCEGCPLLRQNTWFELEGYGVYMCILKCDVKGNPAADESPIRPESCKVAAPLILRLTD